MTNRRCFAGATLTSPEGSSVFSKSRFFRYVLRFLNDTVKPQSSARSRSGSHTERKPILAVEVPKPNRAGECNGPSRLLERLAQAFPRVMPGGALSGLDLGRENPLPHDQQGNRKPAEAADGRRRDRRCRRKRAKGPRL